MARVSAVSGATGEEFEELKNIAEEMGSKTEWSAVQSAEALTYLSMAGFKVKEQISALPSVLALASSAQIDLGRSADIVSNIMTGFGISADETGHAVDVLVKTMTTANTDLPMLGEAMKYVAPVAKSLGLSVEETAAAIAKMSDAGIQGSNAGTALRAALLSLANPTGQTVDAMEALGINIESADGKMKPLPELIGHIAEKLGGMEAAQKTATVAQLVGVEAASGFIALLDVGEDKLRDYSKQLENSGGTAERVAKTQMATLIGAFKEWQSAVEGIGISIGDEFLPVFTEITRKGTDLVRVFGELDGATLSTGLKMIGASAGIALVASTAVKLGVVFRGLMLTMGPAGWVVLGLSIIGGLLVGVRDGYSRMNEVNLDTVNGMNSQHKALQTSIERYDSLKLRSRLSNDELARFVDINSEITKTANPQIIEALRKEQELLTEKSTLSNEELAEMVALNDQIIEKVPTASTTITEQGNALLDGTEAAKKYNAEQLEMIRLELENQRVKAEANYIRNIEREQKLIEEINGLNEDRIELEGKIADKVRHVADEQKKADEAKANGNKIMEWYHRQNVELSKIELQNMRDELVIMHDTLLKKQTKLGLTREELRKLDEVKRKMIDIEMAQVGINAKHGQEIGAIDTEITRLSTKKRVMEQSTPAAARNTQEYRNSVAQIDRQISSLWGVRSRVLDISSKARSMNYELGRNIRKTVTVVTKGGAGTDIRRTNYHTGGLVGREPMPKLHDGGLAAQFANAPMHNEIDVRLLKNEMVLTEAQQANLMRMIDAGLTGGAKPAEQVSRDTSIQQSITINSAEALSPSEIARKNKQALRELAMEWEAK
jgi:TP901 family phage tail tape measure protein